jgi:hypothetical protein
MRIDVTQEDIEKGERRHACRCPIARAISRAASSQATVGQSVAGYSAWIGDTKVLLPACAAVFAHSFDAGDVVSPFSFDLEVPQ